MKWIVSIFLSLSTLMYSAAPAKINLARVPIHKRISSFPYITGDTFRAYADFVIDETNQPFFPDKVKAGDLIFVNSDYLEFFFRDLHPIIPSAYILITHNSSREVPGTFSSYLDDDKLIAWFGTNISNKHPKLYPIPVGLPNHCQRPQLIQTISAYKKRPFKEQLLYLGNIQNSNDTLHKVKERFTGEGHLQEAKFAICLDPSNHEIWEALYLDVIPIVISSSPILEDLPVVVVKDWNEITPDFLEEKYQEMQKKNGKKLQASFWFKLIDAKRYPYLPL